MLDWTREQLALEAGLEEEAIELYEGGEADLSQRDLRAIGAVLNELGGIIAKGATLHAGEGLRFIAGVGELDQRPRTARRRPPKYAHHRR